MSNVRWSIVVPEETDRALRSFLAQRGTKKGDISRFVEEAVQSHLFELTVEGIKERNRPHDQNVSRYPKLRRFIKPAEAGNLVNGLRHQATVLETLPTLELSPDPDDNPVLAMAETSQAQYLVSGDKEDLLALGAIGGTRIVTARQFVEALGT
jgi:putative PIN family toxin of toxin-antitoxin system